MGWRGQTLPVRPGQHLWDARLMATLNKPVDVVIVGFGWTGAIMAIELAQSGLSVLALERGEDAATVPNWAYPKVVDEIAQSARNGLLQNLSKSTVTIRHHKDDRALPYRQIGSAHSGTRLGRSRHSLVRRPFARDAA